MEGDSSSVLSPATESTAQMLGQHDSLWQEHTRTECDSPNAVSSKTESTSRKLDQHEKKRSTPIWKATLPLYAALNKSIAQLRSPLKEFEHSPEALSCQMRLPICICRTGAGQSFTTFLHEGTAGRELLQNKPPALEQGQLDPHGSTYLNLITRHD